jgi:VanZ family protein
MKDETVVAAQSASSNPKSKIQNLKSFRAFVRWWLPVIAWMIVIFIGSSIGNVPRVGGKTTDGIVHRAAHVLEFAVLGALTLRALSKERPITKRELIITLSMVAVYGASDEFHQRFTPGRSSEGLSVLFDIAGGLIGVWAWRWWIMRRPANRQPGRVVVIPAESTVEAPSDH